MRVLVVGGAGKMGRWFARYFLSKGDEVYLFDIREFGASPLEGARIVSDPGDVMDRAQLVLVSVPIREAPHVVRSLPYPERDITLAEISSIKAKVVQELRRLPDRVEPLSLHPLFGPGLRDPSLGKMAVIEVKNLEEELAAAKKIMPGFRLTGATPEEHDRAMAMILSATYVVNIAYLLGVDRLGEDAFRELSGTTSLVQLVVSHAVASQDAGLISDLIAENPYTLECIRSLCEDMAGLVDRGRVVESLSYIRRKYGDGDLSRKSYGLLYRIFDMLRRSL